MLRSGAPRSILRAVNAVSRPAFNAALSPSRQQVRSQLCTLSRRPLNASLARPLAPRAQVWVRGASSIDKVDKKQEEAIQQKKIPATPETVSTTSTTIPVSGSGAPQEEQEPQMMAGIYHDLVRPQRRWT